MRQSLYSINRSYREARDELRRDERERCHTTDAWTFVLSLLLTVALLVGSMVIDPLNSGLF